MPPAGISLRPSKELDSPWKEASGTISFQKGENMERNRKALGRYAKSKGKRGEREVANMLKDGRIAEQQILEMKRTWIDSISKLAESKGITFDRTSYWSILDAIDHNVVRANIQRQKDGKEPFETVYAGLYGDGKNLGKLNDVQKNISSIRESAVEATESMTRSENITSSFDNIKKITQDLSQEQSLDTNEVDKE